MFYSLSLSLSLSHLTLLSAFARSLFLSLSLSLSQGSALHKQFARAAEQMGAEFECVLALQLVHHRLGAPKGLMSRLLQDFYEADVLTEEAYTKWRDDNKDETPGKLKAISDATAWLNWLAEQESESEEED